MPPPPYQQPAAQNGNGKAQRGWPSLDESSPKGSGKKRIVVLGSGAPFFA